MSLISLSLLQPPNKPRFSSWVIAGGHATREAPYLIYVDMLPRMLQNSDIVAFYQMLLKPLFTNPDSVLLGHIRLARNIGSIIEMCFIQLSFPPHHSINYSS